MKSLLTIVWSLAIINGFSQGNFRTGSNMLWCGDAKIIFASECANDQPGIMMIHVHENEKTAVEAAKKMLVKYNRGCFVTWQCQNDRYVKFALGTDTFKFDPNRIYTDKGREATLKANGNFTAEGDKKVKGIAKSFLEKYIDSQRLVIAVHNNTDGGGLGIRSFLKGGEYAEDAKKVAVCKARDGDDFFLTTDARIYEFLKKKDFNIILQDNELVADDGSLSVYAASKQIAYLNVEAQHGHLKEQLEMLDAVQELIATFYQ